MVTEPLRRLTRGASGGLAEAGGQKKRSPNDQIHQPTTTPVWVTFNNGEREVVLLVGGEAPRRGSRVFYPLHPSRRSDMNASDWWEDVPARTQGPHDGLPDAMRKAD